MSSSPPSNNLRQNLSNTLSDTLINRISDADRGPLVKMQPAHKKLQERAVRIASQISGAQSDVAGAVHSNADWLIKRINVMPFQSCNQTRTDETSVKAVGIRRTALGA